MRKKVLIIDDEEDFGLLLKGFFNKREYDVCVSNTIEGGMKALEEIKPDLVFLDNNLPDGLGWGKTEFILKNYPQTQLNLITAYNVPKKSPQPYKMYTILEKPITVDDLSNLFK